MKLRLNPHRGRSTDDPDSPLVGIIDAMAEKKIVTVSAAKGYAALKKTLQVVDTKGQLVSCQKPSRHMKKPIADFTLIENWKTA